MASNDAVRLYTFADEHEYEAYACEMARRVVEHWHTAVADSTALRLQQRCHKHERDLQRVRQRDERRVQTKVALGGAEGVRNTRSELSRLTRPMAASAEVKGRGVLNAAL